MKYRLFRVPVKIVVFLVNTIPNTLLEVFIRNYPDRILGGRLRLCYYKRKFYSCGTENFICEGTKIFSPQLIQIGSRSSIGRYTELNPGPGKAPCLIIGDDTWIGPSCFFRTANHKFDDPDTLFIKQGHEEKTIILGNDIYVGAYCIFLGGAEVGDHSVIAAGSVVSTNIPPYSIVGGNPARVIRKRK